ncbi:MAG: exosortase A [Immundisolibacter sp.]|uniref:exosortase A n=1 Tax=Immundisolibacter sp. TaxID=1934948 RepID=UPI003D0B4276
MKPDVPTLAVNALASTYRWRTAAGLLLLTLALTLWAFADTAASLGVIWWRSETYAHGLLVVPVAAWLLWQRRDAVLRAEPRAQPWALLLLLAAGGLWALGRLGAVLAFEHFALYFLLLGGAWLVAGTDALRRAAFPVGFALFAVPFGDFLVVPLQDFTAHFTVAAVRLTGVPIYREGYDLALPSGNWRVAEVCSGLRYVIASAVLGVLYAHLTYRSRWRQAAFIGVSLVVPVLANGLRAFTIVMIGHVSSMRLAVGVDHLIYGWIFFVVVMMALFAIGALWREDRPAAASPAPATSDETGVPPVFGRQSARAALAVVLSGLALLLVWPPAVRWLDARNDHAAPPLSAPQVADWPASDVPFTRWSPYFESPRALAAGAYQAADGPVGLVLAYYNNQAQHGELVSWQNTLTGRGLLAWGEIDRGLRRVRLPRGESIEVREALLHGGGPSVLAWTWYWTPMRSTASPTIAKLLGTLGRLLGRGDDAAQVVLYVPIDHQPEDAAQRLERLVIDARPVIDRELAAAYRQAAAP